MNNNEIQELMEEVEKEIRGAEEEVIKAKTQKEMLMGKLKYDHGEKTLKAGKKKAEKTEEGLTENQSLFIGNLKKFKEKYEELSE